MKNKSNNYLFYWGFFFISLFLQCNHFFLLDSIPWKSARYFLCYAVGQVLFMTILLYIIGYWVEKLRRRKYSMMFVFFVFSLLMIQVIDYILVRLMDMSFWYALGMMSEEKLQNFMEMIYLTGVPLWLWLLLIPLAIGIPFMGYFIYRTTFFISNKMPIPGGNKIIKYAFLSFPVAFLLLDLAISGSFTIDEYEQFRKALPWKHVLIGPSHERFELSSKIVPKPPRAIELKNFKKKVRHKPHIFLFVVESLRDDFINEQIAPNLTKFKEESVSFAHAFSNANATQLSWFSIFSSKLPFYWNNSLTDDSERGSLPLNIFKHMGYKIHLYSSAQLKYYEMDEQLFGKWHTLIDSEHAATHSYKRSPWECDLKAVNALLKNIKNYSNEEGHLHIVFLDATHFNYSWPEILSPFEPYLEEMTNFRVSNSIKNIELIKNRYRNAIHYIDVLYGLFLNALKSEDLFDDSLIVFTGDHGEEFLEHGHLFHASHLTKEQLRTPIYYKFPGSMKGKTLAEKSTITSHVDIFPTLFDAVLGDPLEEYFDGQSLFNPSRKPYIIAARYNGSRPPTEFVIQSDHASYLLKFEKYRRIFNSSYMQLISIDSFFDENKDHLIESFLIPSLEETFNCKFK